MLGHVATCSLTFPMEPLQDLVHAAPSLTFGTLIDKVHKKVCVGLEENHLTLLVVFRVPAPIFKKLGALFSVVSGGTLFGGCLALLALRLGGAVTGHHTEDAVANLSMVFGMLRLRFLERAGGQRVIGVGPRVARRWGKFH